MPATDLTCDHAAMDLRVPDGLARSDKSPDAASVHFGPTTSGTYLIGSSFAMGVQSYIQTLTQEAGLAVSVAEWTVGGASINSLWNDTSAQNPALLQSKLAEITSGKFGLLFMNAQQPWLQTDTETLGVGRFAGEALKGNPSFRLMIQVYWTFEQDPYRFRETSTRWEDLMMVRFGALRVAYQVGKALNAPVFVAPVGEAIERVKERAAKGQLSAYTSRSALHEADGQHLSGLGNYVQASVIHAGAYQRYPQGQSKQINSSSGSTLLTEADAKLIWDDITESVRKTPFSGWYEQESTTLSGYMAALKKAISNWETFDGLSASGGSFTGEDGFSWTVVKGKAAASTEQLIGRTLSLESGGSLAGSIPKGVGVLFFVFSPLSTGPAATLEVWLGGTLAGTYTRSQDNRTTKYATMLTNLNAKGPVTLEIKSKGAPCLLDNVQWTDFAP